MGCLLAPEPIRRLPFSQIDPIGCSVRSSGQRGKAMGTKATEAQAPDYFADAPGYATHEVLNQAGALADYDAYGDDTPFVRQ